MRSALGTLTVETSCRDVRRPGHSRWSPLRGSLGTPGSNPADHKHTGGAAVSTGQQSPAVLESQAVITRNYQFYAATLEVLLHRD